MPITVVVPTHSRPKKLLCALQSIANQNFRPSLIIVVCDDPSDIEGLEELTMKNPILHFEVLYNSHTKNLSGALNTAADYLVQYVHAPDDYLLTFLDDDDTWEPDHLSLINAMWSTKAYDMLYTGILRFDNASEKPIKLKIPRTLTRSDFLTGNPHIQMSNLAVRFSSLLKAGCFDDNLDSTVDRDLCIRLLDLGSARYSGIDAYTVNHNAIDAGRLSTPGNIKKSSGLNYFFYKFSSQMNPLERDGFRARSKQYFGVDIEPSVGNHEEGTALQVSDCSSLSDQHLDSSGMNVIAGFTADCLEDAQLLVADLETFFRNTDVRLKIVICENSISPLYSTNSGDLGFEASNIVFIPSSTISVAASDGAFGDFYRPVEHQKGTAFGRSVLQYYLYRESMAVVNPVFWILDGDVRLTGSPDTPSCPAVGAFLESVNAMADRGIHVGIGRIAGVPPIPGESMIRTQLLDVFYSLLDLVNGSGIDTRQLPDKHSLPHGSARFRDFYYDNSVVESRHLEYPMRLGLDSRDFSSALQEIAFVVQRIAKGINVTRRIEEGARNSGLKLSKHTYPRGGNTIVLGRGPLRLFPVISPFNCDLPFRRGDTVWELFAGFKENDNHERYYTAIDLAVFQSRENSRKPLSIENLFSDVYGTCFENAMEEHIALTRPLESVKSKKDVDPDSPEFTGDDVNGIISRFEDNIRRRSVIIVKNFWRINGLIESFCSFMEHHREIIVSKSGIQSFNESERSLAGSFATLKSLFSNANLKLVLSMAESYRTSEIKDFIYNFRNHVLSYRKNLQYLPDWFDLSGLRNSLQKKLGVESLNVAGSGREGVVYMDGDSAYKVFYNRESKELADRVSYLKSYFESVGELRYLNRIREFFDLEGFTVAVSAFVKGETYHGGHTDDFIGLLKECRDTGIVITNVSPENIIDIGDSIRYIDTGNGIEPYTEGKFSNMLKRCFLTVNFHWRPDIKELMHASLTEDIPELEGYEVIFSGLGTGTSREQLDPVLLSVFDGLERGSVLDFGCGDGRISEKLDSMGFTVTAYDVDENRFIARKRRATVNLVKSLSDAGEKFSVTLASLVLCTVAGENEVDSILNELRSRTSDQGKCIISICNPFSDSIIRTANRRIITNPGKYGDTCEYHKIVTETDRERIDYHRPFSFYERKFNMAGFRIDDLIETPGIDFNTLLPASDFLIFVLSPVERARDHDVTLMIKASAMEWRTISWQVKHIVKMLEGPVKFTEKIIVTDTAADSFSRQYDSADPEKFSVALKSLVTDRIVDRIVTLPADMEKLKSVSQDWFDVHSGNMRSTNGQPILATLNGLDECRTDYVLQLDSDCVIGYLNDRYDYLTPMVDILEKHEDCITVAFPILSDDYPAPSFFDKGKDPWRVEVRFSLISLKKLRVIRPLPNELTDGNTLQIPWHRSLDIVIRDKKLKSARLSGKVFFIHIPNEAKRDSFAWYNILKAVERGSLFHGQKGNVDLRGDVWNWIGSRTEKVQVVTRGRNVQIQKIRRCFNSLKKQSQQFGLTLIDAGSETEYAEFIEYIMGRYFSGRLSILLNHEPLTTIENIDYAIRNICSNDYSIIIQVDADDSLIGENALSIIKDSYSNGADVTAGSMIQNDKGKRYFVDFTDPRHNRGGNVWVHPRTFYRRLYNSVPKHYLKISGKWIDRAEDWSYMVPISEIANNAAFIESCIYLYDPSPDKKMRSDILQEETISKILSKPPLKLKGDMNA